MCLLFLFFFIGVVRNGIFAVRVRCGGREGGGGGCFFFSEYCDFRGYFLEVISYLFC